MGLPCCSGQVNSVVLCGVELRVGMPKAEVLAELRKQCKVQEMPRTGGQDWCVGGAYICSHQVGFEGDKLRMVQKELGSAEGADADVLADFITTLERIVGGTISSSAKPAFASGPAIVIVNTTVAKVPLDKRDVVMKELRLRLGQKDIVIQVNRPVGAGAGSIGLSAVAAKEELWEGKTR